MNLPENTDYLVRRLRLRHVELLATLADTGTVRATAGQLNLSQPAISKMLAEIEQAFGVRLFERSRRGLSANPFGVAAVHRARIILAELSRATGEVHAIRAGATAVLRVGTLSVTTLVPAAIVLMQSRMPGAVVQIHEARVTELLRRLLDGELDCVFGAVTPEVVTSESLQSLQSEVMVDDQLCVLASGANPLVHRRRLHWRDLHGARWVTPPRDTQVRQSFMMAFLNEGLTPPLPAIDTLSPVTIGTLLRLDPTLLGAVRFEQAKDEIARGSVCRLRVSPAIPMPPLCLFTREHGLPQPAAVLVFAQALRDSARSPVKIAAVAPDERAPAPRRSRTR